MSSIELLKKENELLKKENRSLKKEIESLQVKVNHKYDDCFKCVSDAYETMVRDEIKEVFYASEDGCHSLDIQCPVCDSNTGYEENEIQEWADDLDWKK
jgi:vacuolar-type H+-ATPase subunit D/Vma8